MIINADGIDREATEAEIAEIIFIRNSAFDIQNEIKQREASRKAIATKLGLTDSELAALLS